MKVQNSNWATCKIEDHIKLIDYRGRTPKKVTTGVRLITAKNVKLGYLELDPEEFIEEKLYDSWMTRGIPNYGDIIFTTEAPLANVAQLTIKEKVAFAQRIIVMQPQLNKLDQSFLKYLLLSDSIRQKILSKGTGATVQGIKSSLLKKIEIPLPPLPAQKRIVALLDEAFSAISRAREIAEKNLANTRELFESYLQGVFANPGEGWVEKTIGEISKHTLGKMLDKVKNKGELRPYLRNLNVRWFNFDLSDLLEMRFLPEETEKYMAKKGDVLICEGGYPGRAAIWNEDYPIYFQKALHRVRFYEIEHNKWFVYFLYSQDKNGKLQKNFNGTGIQHFTGEVLHRFKIPIPPLPTLRQLVKRIEELSDETQSLEAVYRQKIVELDELKKVVLEKAFRGEL